MPNVEQCITSGVFGFEFGIARTINYNFIQATQWFSVGTSFLCLLLIVPVGMITIKLKLKRRVLVCHRLYNNLDIFVTELPSEDHSSTVFGTRMNNKLCYLTRLFPGVSTTSWPVGTVKFFFPLEAEIVNKSSIDNANSLTFKSILSHFRNQSKRSLCLSLIMYCFETQSRRTSCQKWIPGQVLFNCMYWITLSTV